MNMRRPVAAVFNALTLVGGPVSLTACSPAGGGQERNDGTTDDDGTNTSGANPGGTSQGNVPDNDDRNTTGNEDRDNNEDGDSN